VGTITEIYVTFVSSKLDRPRRTARNAASPFRASPPTRIVRSILQGELAKSGDRVMILRALVRGQKGEYRQELEKLARDGYVARAHRRRPFPVETIRRARQAQNHTIEVLIDRLW